MGKKRVQDKVADETPQSEQPFQFTEEPSVSPEETTTAAPEVTNEQTPIAEEHLAVSAMTHHKKRSKSKKKTAKKEVTQPVVHHKVRRWPEITGIVVGGFAVLILITTGVLVEYYKHKTLPNVVVAGINSGAKNVTELRNQLTSQQKDLKLTLKTDGKTLQPKLDEIGYHMDTSATIRNALSAKRHSSLLTKLAFWKKQYVPAVITINDTLFNQYIETNTPGLSKSATDAQLVYNADQEQFTISNQAPGSGPDTTKLKQELIGTGYDLRPQTLSVGITKKNPTITQEKLQPLLEPANQLLTRKIVLTGLGRTYIASTADIATWFTPTPKEDGSVKLVVDTAKISSYVSGIGAKIASPPQDKKIIQDDSGGPAAVLQEGHDGTQLADAQSLTNTIAQALTKGQDISLPMTIQTAAYKTVNMTGYDKWVEVDLTAQRLTAYEKANPVRSFLISSGVRGHETVTGEFSIWLKVRSQTMAGGSKAAGDYYNLPNVEWVNYFYQDYALHGAYWHHNWGHPMSHGCVNEPNDQAQWIYEWAPIGTKVIVHY